MRGLSFRVLVYVFAKTKTLVRTIKMKGLSFRVSVDVSAKTKTLAKTKKMRGLSFSGKNKENKGS